MKETKHIIPPCPKCPYKLGQVKTLINPCPQCKRNGYGAYDSFTRTYDREKHSE